MAGIEKGWVKGSIINNLLSEFYYNFTDQPVPQGLHIRIDLSTGKREAKLLDSDSTNDENSTVSELAPVYETDPVIQYDNKYAEEIKKRVKEMKGWKKSFSTELEVLDKLMAEFIKLKDQILNREVVVEESKVKAGLSLLGNIEFIVGQIDSANHFVVNQGIEKIIIPGITNHTHIELKSKMLNILGIILQNNPFTQIQAFEKNIGEHLNYILSVSKLSQELKACMFAYGSLIRGQPEIQRVVLAKGGTGFMLTLLQKEINLDVKVKILTLISDLLLETSVQSNNDFSIERMLEESNYCDSIEDFFHNLESEISSDFSVSEKLLENLMNSKILCRKKWTKSAILKQFIIMNRNRYATSEEGYENDLSVKAQELLEFLSVKRKPKEVTSKDEL